MKIVPVVPRGYCKGVVRAINLAKQSRSLYPTEKITMLGMLVHNQYVVDACSKLGIKCEDDPSKTRKELLTNIKEGVVIFTAHGVGQDVYEQARKQGLTILDATCEDVLKTHTLVIDHTRNGGDVIFIGKKHHPEAEGICSLSEHIHLVENEDDLANLDNLHNVLITTQTTMNVNDTKALMTSCLAKYPKAIITPEICNATRIRQEAIANLDNIDVLIVVGDPRSNNTQKLNQIGSQKIKEVHMVENANQLETSWFKASDTIAVTSGASTPTYLTNQVINSLNTLSETGILPNCVIDIDEILD